MSPTSAPSVWRNRIVRMGSIRAGDALANEQNWRVHPQAQQQALAGALNEVGWVTGVIVNLRNAEEWGRDQNVETIVDGHARIGEALRVSEDTEIPVIYVDLSPSEERLVLATFDPLSAMAIPDRAQLESLLQEVGTGEAAVQAMLDQLAAKNGLIPPIDPLAEWQGMPEFEQADQMPSFRLIVNFASLGAVQEFSGLIGQEVNTEPGRNTKSIWFPVMPREDRMQVGYQANES